ncbi:MAG: hypothetical protein LBP40_08025 [Campylobacteraceae bacterium]|jgi:hypothetical protein|nr:hypothetical protein [Campylobacteraceae bacterium]
MSNELKILETLYDSDRALSSLDFGSQMSNPNQYFCKLKTLGLIAENTLKFKNGQTVKIRFIPMDKRANALKRIKELKKIELAKANSSKKAIGKSRIGTSTPTDSKNKAGQAIKSLFDIYLDRDR